MTAHDEEQQHIKERADSVKTHAFLTSEILEGLASRAKLALLEYNHGDITIDELGAKIEKAKEETAKQVLRWSLGKTVKEFID